MQNAASMVISRLGGAYRVADLVGIDVSQVYRWTYPKKKGGTGGSIPARHFKTILSGARSMNIDLSPEELIGISGVGDSHKPLTNGSRSYTNGKSKSRKNGHKD